MAQPEYPTSDDAPAAGHFALVYLGAMLAVTVLASALEAVVGVPLPSGAGAVVPSIIAAMLSGQRYAKRHGAIPSALPSWRFGMVGTVIAFLVSGAVAAAMLPVIPDVRSDLAVLTDLAGIVLIVAAFYFAVSVLLVRQFVRIGAKGVLRQATSA